MNMFVCLVGGASRERGRMRDREIDEERNTEWEGERDDVKIIMRARTGNKQ